ncbi:hypothetical protein PAHAL_7G348800 [Panicum hallii]|uniref:Uncharacterized protein n=1 Tax=Panicum hallii TaxID=206008 RepID=A0A2S3IC05_9POAL|nr:uncharacterized protein LOC112899138 [Panicum hallii]PAN40896.1 hypothetical protein PAHAL_7G348800 [Panicum hallii]
MNKPPAYGHGQGDSPYCCFHPRELVVGVCAHCLKDRLLLLLAATTNNAAADATLRRRRTTTTSSSSSSISLPKVFALGSSFLQRLDSRHRRPDAAADDSDGTTSAAASPDDSFISIKFEDNGKATWDSHKAAAISPGPAPVRSSSSSTAVVVEHVKRGGITRWRKQVVGRLLQLARWKRSAVGLDGKKAAGERSKARGRGWIRSLTRRRAAGDRAWS